MSRKPITAQIDRKPVSVFAPLDDAHPANEILMGIAITDWKVKPRHAFAIDYDAQATTGSAPRVQGPEIQNLGTRDKWAHISAIMGHVPVIVIDKAVAVRSHPVHRAGKFLRKPQIVGVKEGDEPASGGL